MQWFWFFRDFLDSDITINVPSEPGMPLLITTILSMVVWPGTMPIPIRQSNPESIVFANLPFGAKSNIPVVWVRRILPFLWS
jgi:hypothetical protein